MNQPGHGEPQPLASEAGDPVETIRAPGAIPANSHADAVAVNSRRTAHQDRHMTAFRRGGRQLEPECINTRAVRGPFERRYVARGNATHEYLRSRAHRRPCAQPGSRYSYCFTGLRGPRFGIHHAVCVRDLPRSPTLTILGKSAKTRFDNLDRPFQTGVAVSHHFEHHAPQRCSLGNNRLNLVFIHGYRRRLHPHVSAPDTDHDLLRGGRAKPEAANRDQRTRSRCAHGLLHRYAARQIQDAALRDGGCFSVLSRSEPASREQGSSNPQGARGHWASTRRSLPLSASESGRITSGLRVARKRSLTFFMAPLHWTRFGRAKSTRPAVLSR